MSLLVLILMAAGCDASLGSVEGPVVLSVEPAEGVVSRNPEFRLLLDRHIDPYTSDPRHALELRSGSLTLPLITRYDLLGPALVTTPAAPLQADVGYRIALRDPSSVLGFSGNPLRWDAGASFVTGSHVEDEDVLEAPLPDFAAAGCLSCHGEGFGERQTLFSLEDPWALVGTPSTLAPERMLVVSGQPARSVLLHKIAPGYPDRVGQPMPPGASEAQQGTFAQDVSRWIAAIGGSSQTPP